MEPRASIFVARGFVTLNRRIPQATDKAVREGRILGLGGAELLERKPT